MSDNTLYGSPIYEAERLYRATEGLSSGCVVRYAKRGLTPVLRDIDLDPMASIETALVRVADVRRAYYQLKHMADACFYGTSHPELYLGTGPQGYWASGKEMKYYSAQIENTFDMSETLKQLKEDHMSPTTTKTEEPKPENRAEVVLRHDLTAHREGREFHRRLQRQHEGHAKDYKNKADKCAKAVTEIEAAMKKSGFAIPEDTKK